MKSCFHFLLPTIALFILSLFSCNSSQTFLCANQIRTDGYYLYDNGIDTIIDIPVWERRLLAEITTEINGKQGTNLSVDNPNTPPCVPRGVIPAYGSSYLHFIAFLSADKGIAFPEICRDSTTLRNVLDTIAAHFKNPEAGLKMGGDHTLYSIACDSDSRIAFAQGSPHAKRPLITYTGLVFPDSLVVFVNYRMLPPSSPKFLERRTYKFVRFDSLMDAQIKR